MLGHEQINADISLLRTKRARDKPERTLSALEARSPMDRWRLKGVRLP